MRKAPKRGRGVETYPAYSFNRDAEEAPAGLRHRSAQRCQVPPAGERVASLSRFHHVATLRAGAPSTARQATRHAAVTTVRLDTRSPAGACRSTLVALATVTRGSLLCVAVKRSMGDITMGEQACGPPDLCRISRALPGTDLGGPFRAGKARRPYQIGDTSLLLPTRKQRTKRQSLMNSHQRSWWLTERVSGRINREARLTRAFD